MAYTAFVLIKNLALRSPHSQFDSGFKKNTFKSVLLFSVFPSLFADPTAYTSWLQTQPNFLDLAIYCFLLYFILEFTHKIILERRITFFFFFLVGLLNIFPLKLLWSKVGFQLTRKDTLHKVCQGTVSIFHWQNTNAWELHIETSVPAAVTSVPNAPVFF